MPGRIPGSLRELAGLFLRLGVTGVGGPAAHIAAMEAQVVRRRGWLSHEEFMDLVGATNLIPGPNSTELAIHIGYLRGGWLGLVVAGACFIVPAALLTCALAWAYVRYGALAAVQPALHGMQAAVVAVVLLAVWNLGRAALKTSGLWATAGAALGAALLGAPELAVVAAAGLAVALGRRLRGRGAPGSALLPLLSLSLSLSLLLTHGAAAERTLAASASPAAAPSLAALGLFFLKVGSVIYGSGYVLVAFLQRGLVTEHGWLSARAVLDAVAAGQVTPGPVFSTATFVGYLLRGGLGALVATVAIFAPSFALVAALTRAVTWMRRSPAMRGFLDGVNAGSLGLMAAVAAQLLPVVASSRGLAAVAVGAAALGVLTRGRLNPSWMVLLGGGVGALCSL